MTDETPHKWTEEDQRLLHHEKFVAEIIRQRAKDENGGKQKPAWQRFMESTGGAALITVLLGGLLGQCITNQIQKGQKDREHQQAVALKDREFQQAWLKARGDQALVAYQDYLKEEQEVVKRAYELIGNSISASDDLIAITRIDFNPYHPDYSREESKIISEQRITIKDKYIEASAKWRTEREKLGLLMSYYHKGRADVADAWRAAQESITEYMNFAKDWERAHEDATLSKGEIDAVLKDKKVALQVILANLSKSLDQGRQYAWEGWDSIENLKATLESKSNRTSEPSK